MPEEEFQVTELEEKDLEDVAGGKETENNVEQCGCNVVAGCSCAE